VRIAGESRYVDFDEPTGMWCIFGTDSGHAYASFASEEDAMLTFDEQRAFDRMPGTEAGTRNPFYPVNCEFEVLGFEEEFQDGETFRMLGTRQLAEPDRPCGSPGRRLYELTAPVDLLKGYKQTPVTIQASRERPRKVIATIQIKCGRTVRRKV